MISETHQRAQEQAAVLGSVQNDRLGQGSVINGDRFDYEAQRREADEYRRRDDEQRAMARRLQSRLAAVEAALRLGGHSTADQLIESAGKIAAFLTGDI